MTKSISNDTVHSLCLLPVDKAETFSKSKGIKGVYVWGYQAKGQFIPLYVGKSRNIFERIIQHYCRFNGGEYIIPAVLYKDKAPTEPYSIDTSKCFIPSNLKAIYELHNCDNDFLNNKQYIISNFKFTYLKIDGKDENSKVKREVAEKYLNDRIGKERLISSVPILDTMPDDELQNMLDTTFSKYYKINLNQNSAL